MSIIILEGCDCVGKTSLLEELKNYFPKGSTVTKHFSSPPKSLSKEEQHDWCKTEYLHELELHKKFPSVNFLYDRFYFGEQIYAPQFRGYSPNYIPEVEAALNETGAQLVLVEANPEIVKTRFDGVFIAESDIEGILGRYKTAFNASTIKDKVVLDSSYTSTRDLATRLMGVEPCQK